MTDLVIPWVLAGIPFAGALVCLAFGSDPYRVKMCADRLRLSSALRRPPWWPTGFRSRSDGLLPLYLLPIAAVVATLGQPVHEHHRLAWTLTLIFLSLGMAVLTGSNTFGPLCLILIMLMIMFLLYRHHTTLWPISWWGIGSFGVGVVGAGPGSRGGTARLIGGIPGNLCRSVTAHAPS